ncbi:type I 3-dehydroquinate dehydratase [Clostridium botulinum]|uniref:type I 3-dehydroquinate dehydratase n=2 Tax=Clostridium botulinum TaxID=1491 RepID=UPI002F2B87A2
MRGKKDFFKVRGILQNTPILFTFRSYREGGAREVSDEFYFNLNIEGCKMGIIDAIDVELFNQKLRVLELIKIAHDEEVVSRISGQIFGLSVTFGAVKKVSAPGQLNLKELKKVLEMIHKQLE